ncbi:hypothetical protein ACOMHN_023683 [Nucella lapillus]
MAAENSDEGNLGGEHEESGMAENTEKYSDYEYDGVTVGATQDGGDGDGDGSDIGGVQKHRAGHEPEEDYDSKKGTFECKPTALTLKACEDCKNTQGKRMQTLSLLLFPGKRSEYVQQNLKQLQEQCQHFSACTEELYSASNYHLIVAGENVPLKNICGLMYANGGGNYTTLNDKCTHRERQAVRDSIGTKLRAKLSGPQVAGPWNDLNRCTKRQREYGEQPIDTVCRLKRKAKNEYLCGNRTVNKETRAFFNDQLESLHCSCVAINSADGKGGPALPPLARFAIVGGVLLLLLVLIIAVVFLCLRHRKLNRKLKEHKLRYVTSTATEESSATVYQELQDIVRAPKLPSRWEPEGKLLPQGYQLDAAPAVPPERYVRGLMHHPRGFIPRRSPSDGDDRPHSYLEPLADPAPETSGQGRPWVKDRTPAAPVAGQGRGNPYSLAKPVGDHQPNTAYTLDKQVPGHHHNVPASGGYSLARRTDESSSSPGKGSESEAGTYFDALRLARTSGEDEFGYSQLRKSQNPNTVSADIRESAAADDPQYFELEAEAENEEPLENADPALTSTTKL